MSHSFLLLYVNKHYIIVMPDFIFILANNYINPINIIGDCIC